MRTTLRLARVLLICVKMSVVMSEWVDLPQFSNEAKIYRFPAIVRSVNFRDSERKITAPLTGDLSNISRWYSIDEDAQFSNVPIFNEARVTLSSINIKDEDEEATQIESSENNFTQTDSTMTDPDIISTTEPCEEQENQTQDKDDTGFMDYLPVDLLKQVHNTLKTQPTTLKGKIRFLKNFEKALLSEIESRLTMSLAPIRRTRTSDHEHDDIGFPSVEGALMIISLLTFAVYLVRLVMAVIWNMNGSNGSQTIFIGRRKRSTEEMTEELLRVLNYIDDSKYNDYGK